MVTFTSVIGLGTSLACVPEVIQVMVLSATILTRLFHFKTRFLLRDLVGTCSIRH